MENFLTNYHNLKKKLIRKIEIITEEFMQMKTGLIVRNIILKSGKARQVDSDLIDLRLNLNYVKKIKIFSVI